MIEFRLTIVRIPRGRVISAQARIITRGPMATSSSTSAWASRTSCRASVTRPFIPYEPSSVVTWNSSLNSRNRSSQNIRSRLRNPMIEMVYAPLCLNARSCGKIGATPSPPPTTMTLPGCSIWLGTPSGPTKSRSSAPSGRAIICQVVFPTAWMTTVTVPRSRS